MKQKTLSEYDNLAAVCVSPRKGRLSDGNQFFQSSDLALRKQCYQLSDIPNIRLSAVGRVMTCVLGMVVRREREIRVFVKTPFYRVLGSIGLAGENFDGEWRAVEGSRYFQSPYLYKENGFKKKEACRDADSIS